MSKLTLKVVKQTIKDKSSFSKNLSEHNNQVPKWRLFLGRGSAYRFLEHKEIYEKRSLFCNLAKYGFKPFEQHFDSIEHKLEDSQKELEFTKKKLEESDKNIEFWKNKCSQAELVLSKIEEEIIRIKESGK